MLKRYQKEKRKNIFIAKCIGVGGKTCKNKEKCHKIKAVLFFVCELYLVTLCYHVLTWLDKCMYMYFFYISNGNSVSLLYSCRVWTLPRMLLTESKQWSKKSMRKLRQEPFKCSVQNNQKDHW